MKVENIQRAGDRNGELKLSFIPDSRDLALGGLDR